MPYIGPGPSDDTPKDLNGGKLKLDADSDTSITADTDDQIDIEIAGADDFRFTANNFNVLSGSTLTIDSGATITNSGTATGFGGSDPSSADGDSLGTASAEWSDLYLADGGVVYFGNDQDVRLTHSHNAGLTGKMTNTSGNSGIGFQLTLQTGDTDMAAGNSHGQILFQAPDEGTGTDAVLAAAKIAAVAEGDFSSSSNATSLNFYCSVSEDVGGNTERVSIGSAGAFVTKPLAGGHAVFNEGSVDADFRIESNANTHMFFVDGGNNNILIDESAGLTTADGTVHIHKATAGSVTANTTWDELVIENSTHTGITILTPNSASGALVFGDPDDNDVGNIQYDHSTNTMYFYVGATEIADFGTDEVRFNDGHADIDFVVEADTDGDYMKWDAGQSSLQVQASINAAGTIGITSTGDTNTTALDVAQSSANATFAAAYINSSSSADSHTGLGLYITSSGKGSAEQAGALMVLKNTHTSATKPVCEMQNGHTNDIPNILRLHHSPTSNSSDAQLLIDTRAPSGTGFRFLQCVSSSAGTADTEFNLRGDGNAFADGTWAASGADYAEYFESSTGNQIPSGTTVVLDGNNKVRASKSDDDASAILVVIRPKANGQNMATTSCIVGNSAWNHWQGRYLTDDFGQFVLEDCVAVGWSEMGGKDRGPENAKEDIDHHCFKDELWQGTLIEKGGTDGSGTNAGDNIVFDGTDASGADAGDKVDIGYIVKYTSDGAPVGNNPGGRTITGIETQYDEFAEKRKKANPNYDPSEAYTPREERDEWVIVGLLGQVPVLKNEKTGDRWIKMRDISSETEEWLIR